MKSSLQRNLLLALSSFSALPWAASQTVASAPTSPSIAAASAPTPVPPLVPYAGVAVNAQGRALADSASISFLIFKDETGGDPLFAETQTVALDPTGHYKVQLGATLPNGLPQNLFITGQARWLEVQVAGEGPQSRVLLVSVPFAIKAGDATTLGGLPASAFLLASQAPKGPGSAAPANIIPDVNSTVTTPGGTSGYVPEFSGAAIIVDSPIFVLGSDVGIGTATPTAPLTVSGNSVLNGALTVNGDSTFNGPFVLPPPATATASKGYNSQFIKIEGSAWNSSTSSAVNPRFQWVGEIGGNNTPTPTITLNLVSSTTTSAPTETGFHFNANGTMQFAPGQTFPGIGTITGVTAGTALTGGGTSGTVTLNVDKTKVPLLASANTFTGNQSVTGNVSATGALSANGDLNLPATASAGIGVVNIGPVPFLHGYSSGNEDTFVGGAGNFSTTGSANTGIGYSSMASLTSGVKNSAGGAFALKSTTTGSRNAASGVYSLYTNTAGNYNVGEGYAALFLNTTGSQNSALGANALYQNTTGSNNTAIGYSAGPDSKSGALTNATAIGYSSTVSQNNSLILGQTTAGSPGGSFVNVGIGTPTPVSAMEMSVSSAGAIGPVLTLTNPGGTSGCCSYASDAIDFNTQPISTSGTYNPSARIQVIDDGAKTGDINFLSNIYPGSGNGVSNNGLQTNMTIWGNGNGVSIGTNQESAQLEVVAGEGEGIDVFGGEQADGSMTQGVLALRVGGGFSTGTDQGGLGAWILGGDSEDTATSGEGLLVWPGEPSSGATGLAADFEGDVFIDGTLTANTKDFKIDHPLDPANKYLVHTSVESSEMMNIYSGNVTTDELGLATVKLPDWFEAENADFRYQLTVIGQFAQAIVKDKIANGQFRIMTNASHVEVSWQITAVRQDVYAKAHPLVVEQVKGDKERGFYQHPELYGQPKEKQTQWGLHPAMVRQLAEGKKKLREDRSNSRKKVNSSPQTQPASAVGKTFPVAAAPALNPIEVNRP